MRLGEIVDELDLLIGEGVIRKTLSELLACRTAQNRVAGDLGRTDKSGRGAAGYQVERGTAKVAALIHERELNLVSTGREVAADVDGRHSSVAYKPVRILSGQLAAAGRNLIAARKAVAIADVSRTHFPDSKRDIVVDQHIAR